MLYKQRRRLYSQNFLRDPKLVNKLVRNSSIGRNDLVIEIGPGKGSITKELVKVAGKVVAVEIDEKLSLFLKDKFYGARNLEIIFSDFLNFNLPNYPYKVFANIPFNISSDILRKLTNNINFQEGFLVVQKEFAKKVIGKPFDDKNSMTATLLKPWFDISLYRKFSRHDFIPFPHVDSVMIKIERLHKPKVPYFEKENFRDFVLHSYNRENIVYKDFEYLLNKFQDYANTAEEKDKQHIRMEAARILKAQENIQKIYRTRKDKKWRRF